MHGRYLIIVSIVLFAGLGITPGRSAFAAEPSAPNHSHLANATAAACPFCSAIALTFSEQLNSNDVAVVAKLIESPPPPTDADADFPKGTFEIIGVLKGNKVVKTGMTFKTQLVGSYPEGQKFLVMGVDPPSIAWTTPMKASDRLFKYLSDIQQLPEKGADRLVFFQDYFEDAEPALAFDAYDEFARAPYEDLKALKDRMQHDKLIGWIKDTEKTTVNRRRLYFTMLGVCGTKEDAELLESFIKSGNRKQQSGLDALVACYLTLKGVDGVDLIENTFLKDTEVDYVDTLAAVSALRFHGTEVHIIPQQRIVSAIRNLLDRPKMADMIIPDLARWKDWTVMERLVKMFKEADGDSTWLRVPVITYLRACPKPEAAAYIEELRKIDPQSVERADFFLGFGEDDEEGDDWNADDQSGAAPKTGKQPETPKPADKKDGSTGKSGDGSTNLQAVQNQLRDLGKTQPLTPQQPIELAQNGANPAWQPTPDVPVDRTQLRQLNRDSQLQLDETVPTEDGNSNMPVDPVSATYVSTTSSTPDRQRSVPGSGETAAAPIAMAATPNLTMPIILVPLVGSALIFLVMWSVVNGWFERLIF